MATGEDNNKAKEGKGFAGLSSLVSEIETPQSPVTKNEPPAAADVIPGITPLPALSRIFDEVYPLNQEGVVHEH